MSSELSQAIGQVCDEKNIPVESVIESIESALAAAFRKDFGNKLQNLEVEFDIETGTSKVFDVKEIVEDKLKIETEAYIEAKKQAAEKGEEMPEQEMEEGEEIKRYNPKTMLSLTEAKEIRKTAKVGEIIRQQLEIPSEYGRMAAQTAKQVIVQKLREAERDAVFSVYKDKQGELINGTIQRFEGNVVLVDLGDTTGIIPPLEQSRTDNYRSGAKFKFYVKSVDQTPKGPEIVLSRTSPEMLRKLFKLEVPEINAGTVQIKAIAREAGARSKVAVWAKDDSIDPIGSCVGQRGSRVQTIINELGGEKLDIIEWNEDTIKFIINSLSPAKILQIELNEEGKEAKAHVKSDQYSLAIGKAGQNVRLAAKLTGWKIDIVEDNTQDTISQEQEGEDSEEKNAETPQQEDLEQAEQTNQPETDDTGNKESDMSQDQ